MECMLAAICLYVDLAIGYSRDEDVQDAFQAMPEVGWSTLPTENPVGSITLGVDRDIGPVTIYGELDHRSSVPDGIDLGTNSAWVGTRFRF